MSFRNRAKSSFLDKFPTSSLDNSTDEIAKKCKINFSYFCKSQDAGQDFKDWTNDQLIKLLDKMVQYTAKPLIHWEREPVGKGKGHVLEIYSNFPKKSDFIYPKHVPHQALWGRFRLESSVRLIGFTIPEGLNRSEQHTSGYYFCSNTFYVVFLDKNHVFYKNK
jgi:hypothetical protein